MEHFQMIPSGKLTSPTGKSSFLLQKKTLFRLGHVQQLRNELPEGNSLPEGNDLLCFAPVGLSFRYAERYPPVIKLW